MSYILNYKLFEGRTGKKIKTRWTVNDSIITLYYEKYGLHDLGIMEDQIEEFVNDNIGSTESSLNMEAAGVRHIISLNKGEIPKGLPHFSKAQVEAVLKYNTYSKSELREIVKKILDNITEDEKIDNAIKAEEKKKEEREEKRQKEKEEQRKLLLKTPVNRFDKEMKSLKGFEKDVTTPINVGDVIKHKLFGEGEILDVDGDLLEIKFNSYKDIKHIIYDPKFIELVETDYKIEEPKKQIIDKPTIYLDPPKIPKNMDKYRDYTRKKEFEPPKNIYGTPMAKLDDTGEVNNVNVGDILNHKKFGIGEVIDINNNILSIKFDKEIKKVLYKPEVFI